MEGSEKKLEAGTDVAVLEAVDGDADDGEFEVAGAACVDPPGTEGISPPPDPSTVSEAAAT